MPRHFNDLMIGTLELFCCAAKLGSFTHAADSLGISPAAVSKTISRLEKKIGVPLFIRTTRHVTLTKAGRYYADQCGAMLDMLYETESWIHAQQNIPEGEVHINLPNPYAYWRIFPLMPKFRQKYPQIKVHFHVNFREITGNEQYLDLAIIARQELPQNMIARELETVSFVMVASPEYLHHSPRPETLEDLSAHDLINLQFPGETRKNTWPVNVDGKLTEIDIKSHYVCHDDMLSGLYLALYGNGIHIIYDFVVDEAVKQGRLITLLPQYRGPTHTFYLCYLPDAVKSSRTKAFADFIVKELHENKPGYRVPYGYSRFKPSEE